MYPSSLQERRRIQKRTWFCLTEKRGLAYLLCIHYLKKINICGIVAIRIFLLVFLSSHWAPILTRYMVSSIHFFNSEFFNGNSSSFCWMQDHTGRMLWILPLHDHIYKISRGWKWNTVGSWGSTTLCPRCLWVNTSRDWNRRFFVAPKLQCKVLVLAPCHGCKILNYSTIFNHGRLDQPSSITNMKYFKVSWKWDEWALFPQP